MENFEDFLKDEARNFRLQPSPKVWQGIQSEIKKPRRLIFIWSGAASLFLIMSAAIAYYFLGNDNKINPGNSNQPGVVSKYKIENEQNGNSVVRSGAENEMKQNAIGKSFNKTGIIKNHEQRLQAIDEVFVITGGLPDDIISLLDPLFKEENSYHSSAAVLDAKPLDITCGAVNTKSMKKITYELSIGTNISKPTHINYDKYVHSNPGFDLKFNIKYHFTRHLGITTGIGYESNNYRLGAVAITPETIYLPTTKGLMAESADHKLSNENLYPNIRREILISLFFEYDKRIDRKSYASGFAGIFLGKLFTNDYLLNAGNNDRLFVNNKTLNPFLTYASAGMAYHHKINKHTGWVCSYQLKYQTNTTFKKEYGIHESLLVNGLSVGIDF